MDKNERGITMIKRKVQYQDIHAVSEIVAAASKCKPDVILAGETGKANGKSFLGAVSLGVNKEFEVQIDTDDEEEVKDFIDLLKEYSPAGKDQDKKNTSEMYSPLDGRLSLLAEAGDEIFSKELLGNGVEIYPESNEIYSPVDGRIFFTFPNRNAVGIQTENENVIIPHGDMDEIQRNGGKDFVLNVKEGQEVSRGELLLSFDKEALEAQGYDVVTFLLFINRKSGQLHVLRGGNVKHGERIIEVFS